MSTPNQVFDHILEAIKGWPSPYAVDKHAVVKTDEVLRGGMVACLDASGKLQAGLSEGAMGIFVRQNSDDYDVTGDDGNIVGARGAVMSGLVAVGAYELESTEFVEGPTYLPNMVLTSAEPGDDDAGLLAIGTAYVDTICGVCSEGSVTNERSQSVVRFWPVWLPPLTVESSDNPLINEG